MADPQTWHVVNVWPVSIHGTDARVRLCVEGFDIGDGESDVVATPWASVRHLLKIVAPETVELGVSPGVRLTFRDKSAVGEFVAIARRAQAGQLRQAELRRAEVSDTHLPPRPRLGDGPTRALPLLTTEGVPGREVVRALGLVQAHRVMSRNDFSDLGSDIKSNFGGRLKGVEKALDRAVVEVREELAAQASALGGDAVVAVQFTIAVPADKAHTVLMAGTAVETKPISATTAPQMDA